MGILENLSKAIFECRQEFLRKKAYFKWLDAGSPESDGVEFWLEAEKDYHEDVKKPIDFSKIFIKPIRIID